MKTFNEYLLKSKTVISSFEIGGNIYFMDSKGTVISNKILLFPFAYPEDKKRVFSYDIAPNGKLVCATIGILKEESDDGFIQSDLYFFDLHGNSKKITSTDNILEFISQWSPNGDSIIYFDNKTKKYYLAIVQISN